MSRKVNLGEKYDKLERKERERHQKAMKKLDKSHSKELKRKTDKYLNSKEYKRGK